MSDAPKKIRITATSMAIALKVIKERYGPESYILSKEDSDGQVKLIVAVPGSGENTVSDGIEAEPEQQPESNCVDNQMSRVNGIPLSIEDIPHKDQINRMSEELSSLRAYVEYFLPKLVLDKYQNDSTIKSRVLKHMTNNGYSMKFANSIIKNMPADVNAHNYIKYIMDALKDRIKLDDLVGNIQEKAVLFVGAGGVGKTTAIIKILKMLVSRKDANTINVVGLPSSCIAEHGPLKKYSGIMNINFVEIARITPEETNFINHPNQTTLIDCGQYICNKSKTIQNFINVKKEIGARARTILVIAANSTTRYIEDVIDGVQKSSDIDGVIITKLDETYELGNVIEIIVTKQLKILGFINSEDKTKTVFLPSVRDVILKSLDNNIYNRFSEKAFISSEDVKDIGVRDAV